LRTLALPVRTLCPVICFPKYPDITATATSTAITTHPAVMHIPYFDKQSKLKWAILTVENTHIFDEDQSIRH